MHLNTIAKLFNQSCEQETLVSRFCIDSRKIEPGDLFIAIRGENYDGHQFIANAAQQGAVGILCSKPCPDLLIPQIVVEDTLQALAKIASMHRETIHCPVIALTGSNGKTSVKEMCAAILPKPAHATSGNMNNHIGAPLSVLQLKPEHRYAVFELGASHPGDIAYTSAIVRPEVALINNIAPAHIEGFGSIEGVANTKGEIYQSLPKGGTAIINADDDFSHFWDELLENKKVLRFSLNQPQDIYAKDLTFDEQGLPIFMLVTPNGETKVHLQIPGEHSVRNALAAASCCFAVGISLADIASGLMRFTGVAGRLTFRKGKSDSIIIDDSYNANLRSVLTAVDVLAKRQGYRILVLGDLGELGQYTKQHHEEIGLAAAQKGIDAMFTYGIHSENSAKQFGTHARHYSTQEELARDLLLQLNKETTVLVKGSRSAAMEKIVQQLLC